MKKLLTLTIIHQPPRALLGMKKRGFGAGWWNGFGGKVHEGESIENAARREVREEVGLELLDLEKVGVCEFEFQNDPVILEAHVFRATKFSGEPEESEEMEPRWFLESEIPFDTMWPVDRYWYPLFLAGKKFTGRVLFSQSKELLKHEFVEANHFES